MLLVCDSTFVFVLLLAKLDPFDLVGSRERMCSVASRYIGDDLSPSPGLLVVDCLFLGVTWESQKAHTRGTCSSKCLWISTSHRKILFVMRTSQALG